MELNASRLQDYPSYYSNRKKLAKLLIQNKRTPQGHRKHFIGIPWVELRQQLPPLRQFIKKEKKSKDSRLSVEEQQLQEQEKEQQIQSLPRKHLYQTARDHCSSLGIYFQMIQICEPETTLQLSMLFDRVRIQAWINFLQMHHDQAPASIRNRCLHLINVLKWLETFKSCQSHLAAIHTCASLLRDTANQAKYAQRHHTAPVYNENEMIEQGQFFTSEQRIEFEKWTLTRWQEYSERFNQEDKGSYDDAWYAQRSLIALLMDFSEGQRRQVIAEMRRDKIFYEDDTGKFFLETSREKTNRSHTNQVPINKELKEYLEAFLKYIRPQLLIAKDNKGNIYI